MNIEEVKIELTSYCKRRCIHCSSNGDIHDILELSIDKVKEIIDECSRIGINSIVLTGGEATEYKGIEEIVAYIRKRGISNIKLYTMCEPTYEKIDLISRLVELGLSEVIYSLTVSLTTDGMVRFDNVLDFFREISSKCSLSFHYCLTNKTVDDMDKVEELLDKLGKDKFKNLSFLRYVEHGRGDSSLTLSVKELKKFREKILTLMDKYDNKIRLGSPFNILGISNTQCSAGSKTMIVGVDGNVYPCDAMKYFDYMGSGGNIYSHSLEEIYYSNYFREVREASLIVNEECSKCQIKTCQSGCLAQKMLEIIKDEGVITTKWYQENAYRTVNCFDNKKQMKLNAYMGIKGEYGEFCDYIKKLYTHSLTLDKWNKIMELAPLELGDLVWYLSTSFASSFGYSLDEVYQYMLGLKSKYQNNSNSFFVSDKVIHQASMNRDPLCFMGNQEKGYNVDLINYFVDDDYRDSIDCDIILDSMIKFNQVINRIDSVSNKEEAISAVADILIMISKIAKLLFNKSLSDIMRDNIEKLRKRYPHGFDKDIAGERIDRNREYREEFDYRNLKRILVKD